MFIVIPVILSMLVIGLVMWPSPEEQERYEQRKKEKADSLKALKTSFHQTHDMTPKELREGYLDDKESL